jgi:hypothetical protein
LSRFRYFFGSVFRSDGRTILQRRFVTFLIP